MTVSPYRAVAPVSAVCVAFMAQPSAYPPNTRKPDVAPVCGSVQQSCDAEEYRLRAVFGGEPSRERQGRRKAWRFSAPTQPLLPAVRAVLDDKNGAFLRG